MRSVAGDSKLCSLTTVHTRRTYVSLSLCSETTDGEKRRTRNDVHEEEELGPSWRRKRLTAVKESKAGKMYDSYTAEIG